MIRELNAAGFAVQLKHDSEETGNAHGFVSIADEEGTEFARQDEVQHNKHYGKRLANLGAMAAAALAAMAAKAEAAGGGGGAAAAEKPTIFAASVDLETAAGEPASPAITASA